MSRTGESFAGVPWHALPSDAALARLGSDPRTGLTEAEAEARRSRVGDNRLATESTTRWWRLLLRQFNDALVWILVVAATISLAVGETTDAATIIAIVLLNGVLGFVQEYRADRAVAALHRMISPRCRVVRSGGEREMEATALVPGDVVVLGVGDRVPADLRLLRADRLRIDESALTGESISVDKDTAPVDPDVPLAERRGLAFLGTAVTNGSGIGVVIGTGMATELGRVAELTGLVAEERTPLQRRLAVLGRQLGVLALVVAALVAVVGWLAGEPPFEMFLTAVALAVAVVPEGLPAVVTITLVLGIRGMLARRALLRRLPAAETLGSATVICSDKTGTLTRNEMTVQRVWMPHGDVALEGLGYAPDGAFSRAGAALDPAEDAQLIRLLRVAVGCGRARIYRDDDGIWRALGEPTEAALMTAAGKAGLSPPEAPPLVEVPFDADRKRMTMVRPGPDGTHVALVKGAPERLFERATHALVAGESVPLDDALRARFHDACHRLASTGLRTLALADRPLGDRPLPEGDALEQELVLLGVVGMLDPPREAVPGAVATAARAGVRTLMITGDAPGTALAIARRIGLPAARALTGPEIEALDADGLAEVLQRDVVFARTTPEHKLRIVEALQRQGHVVGMTGDGVNDAPALRQADIGIAMGQRGTEVARSAADMILTDDNYASIVGAIEEGRRQYDNIQKFVRYLLTSNAGEVLAIVGNLVLGGPLILLPVQILWMNLVTDGITAVALGVEPVEGDVMARRPRRASEKILDGRALAMIGGLGAYVAAATLALYYLAGEGTEHARTLAFTGLVLIEKVNVFNFRSLRQPTHVLGPFGNPWLIGAWGCTLSLQVAAVHVPFLQTALHTVPLSAADWGLIAAAALPVFFLVEGVKLVRYLRTRAAREP